MNHKIIMVASLCLLACATHTGQHHWSGMGQNDREIKCPDMGTCLMIASESCPKDFTMQVQQGTQSGLTIWAWKPSSDNQFHLLITCK